MREIKFRGSSKEDNKWYYGYLDRFSSSNIYKIHDEKYYGYSVVEEASIGQYTGFTDKNGKEIYEGDILDCGFGVVKRVYFADGRWLSMCSEDTKYDSDLLQDVLSSMCEVIGNTYEEVLYETNNM